MLGQPPGASCLNGAVQYTPMTSLPDGVVRLLEVIRETEHCTNSTRLTQNTVPVSQGYCSFHVADYQYYGLSAYIFRETAQGEIVQYRKMSKSGEHSVFNRWGRALFWYSAYPLFPTAVYSSILLHRHGIPLEKLTNYPQTTRRHNQKTVIFDALLNCILKKKK